MGSLPAFISARATGRDGEACVLWPFAVNPNGYGRVTVRGKSRPAHQLVLESAGFPKPFPRAEVRHLCGVRLCTNVAHLRWGTRSENQRDRFRAHGDTMRGEKNPRAKLCEGNVRQIRKRLVAGEKVVDLADEYGVSHAAIWLIEAGRTWRGVA